MKMGEKSDTFLGLKFTPVQFDELKNQIAKGAPSNGISYHFINAYSIVSANKSSLVHQSLRQGLLICDGLPLSIILRNSGIKHCYVRGVDFMRGILQDNSLESKHYFLGSTQNVLDELLSNARQLNPDVNVVGYQALPFMDDLSSLIPALSVELLHPGATCIWVSLGTPKQDLFCGELARVLPAHIFAVGAAFDFLSGQKTEAPKIFQKIGLEWMFRLGLEPRRLGIRYLIGNLQFIKIAIQHFKTQVNR